MSSRREALSYVGTGAIGVMIGYYVGAKQLLGIQSEAAPPATDTPTDGQTDETPADTPTETTPAGPSGPGLAGSGFPRVQYDNTNAGHPPGTEGPAGSPTPRWAFGVDGNNHTTPAIHDGVAYFGGGGGEENRENNVYAVDARDGTERWRFGSDAAFQSCVAVGERSVYVADNGGELFALDPADGSELWSADFGRASYTAAPVLANGRVYVGDPEAGGVFGFDTATGEQVWSFDTEGGVGSSPALADGVLYCGTDAGTVYAVDTADASVDWEFAADGEVTGAPVVESGSVYVTTATGAVQAVSAEAGRERWTTETDQPIRSSPAVDGSSLYVGDGELFETAGTLYSLDTDDGDTEWTFDPEGSIDTRRGAIIRSPTVGSERVYFGVDSNKVYAVTKDDGTEAWRFDTGVVLSSPAIHEGTLYTGADNDTVYALE